MIIYTFNQWAFSLDMKTKVETPKNCHETFSREIESFLVSIATFLGPPESFPFPNKRFPWPPDIFLVILSCFLDFSLMEILIIYPLLVQYVQEKISWGPGNVSLVSGNLSGGPRNALENVPTADAKLWIFPGKQGHFNPFLYMFPGNLFWFQDNSCSPQGSMDNCHFVTRYNILGAIIALWFHKFYSHSEPNKSGLFSCPANWHTDIQTYRHTK